MSSPDASDVPDRYPDAIWLPSPNFSRDWPDGSPQFATIHITDGQPIAERAAERLCQSKTLASAHFLVGQAGEVYQLVSLEHRAWHAKGWNGESIGIEHVARSPGELSRQWRVLSQEKRRALLPEAVPLDPDSDEDPGFPPTVEQLRSSARLVAWLCRLYSWPADRAHLRPHCECPGTTHLDCGRDVKDGGIWPWDNYLEMVREELERLSAASIEPRPDSLTVSTSERQVEE